jgi:hypothetical protein
MISIKNLLGIFLILKTVYAQSCNIIVPKEPLTAKGLSTAYISVNCDQTNGDTNSYVEALILNKKTGELVAYSPLIVNNGTQPLFPIVKPKFKEEDTVVAIWFGSNANTIILQDLNNGKTLKNANCINGKVGVVGDTFGQVAGCNNVEFFKVANKLIANGKLVIPALGVDLNGNICPTVRSFTVVDADQSDNVVTSYLTDGVNTAQDTPANAAANGNLTVLKNGSDNRLLDKIIDVALGCQAMLVKDLSSGLMRSTQGTNELQATAFQQGSIALVPPTDPMVLFNGNLDFQKVNDYRKIVGQPQIDKNTNLNKLAIDYCTNLINIGTKSLVDNQQLYLNSVSPNVGTNLFDFLGQRQISSFNVLGCLTLLNITSPLAINNNGNITVLFTTVGQPTVTSTTSTTLPMNVTTSMGCGGVQSTTTSSAQLTATNLVGGVQPTTTATNLVGGVQPTQIITSTVTVTVTSTPFPVQFSFVIPNNPMQNCMCNCV